MLTRTIAVELAKDKITVNNIGPGAVFTPIDADVCAKCDHPMAHIANRRALRQYRYYVCRAGACSGQSVPAGALESSLLDQLEELARDPARRRLRRRIKALGQLWRELPVTELTPAIQALVERVSYDRDTGDVAIRLHQRREKK